MKGLKTLLVVFFLGITCTAFAQVEIVPKLTYRPFFGMIDGTMSDLYSSYGAEVNAQFDLIKNSPWKMSAGLGYFGVFQSYDIDIVFVKTHWDIQIHYIYLPVNFLYEFKFGEIFSLLPSLGLNARYGVTGPANVYREFLYSPMDNGWTKNDFFSETYNGAGNGQNRRFTVGAQVGLDFRIKDVILGLAYSLDMTTTNPVTKSRFGTFGVHVGYAF